MSSTDFLHFYKLILDEFKDEYELLKLFYYKQDIKILRKCRPLPMLLLLITIEIQLYIFDINSKNSSNYIDFFEHTDKQTERQKDRLMIRKILPLSMEDVMIKNDKKLFVKKIGFNFLLSVSEQIDYNFDFGVNLHNFEFLGLLERGFDVNHAKIH